MMLFEIAVAAPIDSTLTYNVPSHLIENVICGKKEVFVGRRVLVPLGRRRVTGYILGRTNISESAFKVRDVLQFLDDEPLFYPDIVSTFQWIASYYHYPIGEVIKAALPGGMTPKSVKTLCCDLASRDALDTLNDSANTEWLRSIVPKGKLSPAKTREVLDDKVQRKIASQLIENGVLHLEESVTSDKVHEKLETCYAYDLSLPELPEEREQEEKVFQAYQKGLKDQHGYTLKLSEAKTLYYLGELSKRRPGSKVPRKDLVAQYSGAARAVRALVEKGIVREEKNRIFRSPLGEQLEFFPRPDRLTVEQENVLHEIRPAIRTKQYQPFLLHGVTGSGKTEVYLQAAEETMNRGRAVLVIVPEIALATQLEAHFISRFGEQVVLLHSGLTAAEKFDQWSLALSGKARIVIGARSAVFAPLENVGLIVVDEEHDQGLKQDDSLRYHGRDVAVVRAKYQKSTILLSSATPSVVSYHNALSGKYRLLEMKKRVGDRPLPTVNIVDIRKKSPNEKTTLFSPQLKSALKTNLECQKQSVILLNRRGFSTNVICQECGEPVQCRDCHVTLTLHKARQQLLCHYCGYSIHHLTVCEKCGSTSLVPIGFGTERVEAELRELLPEARIARLDTDTAGNRTEYLRTLKKMRGGAIDILVGTQMVAKGHHFPGVTLVGVVWADGGLNIPDYRAAERTFQLVTQVTGRAGRGDDPGEVFIQTMRPDHYSIHYARDHLYGELVRRELDLRKNPSFPPYVRVAAVHIQGEREDDVQSGAGRLAAACRAITVNHKNEVEVMGPVPSPIDRMKRNYRWQLLIKGKRHELLHGVCRYIQQNKKDLVPNKCRVIVDVDPESLL